MFFALPPGAPIFLLISLTTVFALIPIFGAFSPFGAACAYGSTCRGQPLRRFSLAVYCTVVVSLIDNIMKPPHSPRPIEASPVASTIEHSRRYRSVWPGRHFGSGQCSFRSCKHYSTCFARKIERRSAAPADEYSKPLAESVAEAFQLGTDDSAKPGLQAVKQAPSPRSKRKALSSAQLSRLALLAFGPV